MEARPREGASEGVGPPLRRAGAWLFLALLAAQVAVAATLLVARSGTALFAAWRARGEAVETRWRRHYPPDYLEAVRSIRERVAPDDFYLIVDAEPDERGATYLVHYFLAPRRGVLLGHTRLDRGDLLARRLAQRKLAEWVVWVPAVPAAPELLDRGEALERFRAMP